MKIDFDLDFGLGLGVSIGSDQIEGSHFSPYCSVRCDFSCGSLFIGN